MLEPKGADVIDSEGNMHCFMLLLSSLFAKISVLTQCRILVAVHCVQDGNSWPFASFR